MKETVSNQTTSAHPNELTSLIGNHKPHDNDATAISSSFPTPREYRKLFAILLAVSIATCVGFLSWRSSGSAATAEVTTMIRKQETIGYPVKNAYSEPIAYPETIPYPQTSASQSTVFSSSPTFAPSTFVPTFAPTMSLEPTLEPSVSLKPSVSLEPTRVLKASELVLKFPCPDQEAQDSSNVKCLKIRKNIQKGGAGGACRKKSIQKKCPVTCFKDCCTDYNGMIKYVDFSEGRKVRWITCFEEDTKRLCNSENDKSKEFKIGLKGNRIGLQLKFICPKTCGVCASL